MENIASNIFCLKHNIHCIHQFFHFVYLMNVLTTANMVEEFLIQRSSKGQGIKHDKQQFIETRPANNFIVY